MLKNNISCEEKNCTGCGACHNVCPTSAISMKIGRGGFFEPYISDDCVNCGMCVRVCPAINDIKRSVNRKMICYAMINNNLNEIEKSSSGGIFFKVAKYVIENLNGVIYGAVFDGNFNVKIDRTESVDNLEAMVGSKYVYSTIGSSYKQVEQDLKNGKTVLYSGISCQIAGLYSYLREEYSKLITIEVLCHGAPSQLLFDKYIKHIENKYKSKLKSINQRDKEKPWNPLITKSIKLKFENNKEKSWAEDFDPYMSLYVRELAYRDSCYKCKYVGTERNGDIVLGDFGGLGMLEKCSLNVKKGVSLVLVNTEQGKEIINNLENINMEERNIEEVIMLNSCLRNNVKRPSIRQSFIDDFENLSETDFFNKYYYKNYAYRLRAIIKRSLFRVIGPKNVAKIIYSKKKKIDWQKIIMNDKMEESL